MMRVLYNLGYVWGALVVALILMMMYAASAWAEDISHFVPSEVVSQKIAKQLLADGHIVLDDPDNSMEVKIAGYYNGFGIASQQSSTPIVHNLAIEERMQRFSADIEFPGAQKRYSIHGRYEEVADLPVLRHRLRTGTVISKEDVVWKKVPLSKIKARTITRVEDLLGKQTTRFLRKEKPIEKREVMPPYMVEEDEVVQMLYQTPYMQLQVPGKVLQDGIEGDLVKVTNMESGKTILAKVAGDNTVVVAPSVLKHDVRMAYGY